MAKQAKRGKRPAAADAADDAAAEANDTVPVSPIPQPKPVPAPAEEPVPDPVGDPSQKQLQPEKRCAYECLSPSKDEPFPLRTHCICDEKLFANDVAQGSEVPWKSCSAQGCKAAFHGPCCATASVSHGLTGVHYDTQKMFSPAHHKDMNTAHRKEYIMLKHMHCSARRILNRS